MSDKWDEAKGRAKEAAGALTDDEDLKTEGKLDRLAGEAKAKANQAADTAKEVVDRAKDKVADVVRRDDS